MPGILDVNTSFIEEFEKYQSGALSEVFESANTSAATSTEQSDVSVIPSTILKKTGTNSTIEDPTLYYHESPSHSNGDISVRQARIEDTLFGEKDLSFVVLDSNSKRQMSEPKISDLEHFYEGYDSKTFPPSTLNLAQIIKNTITSSSQSVKFSAIPFNTRKRDLGSGRIGYILTLKLN
jgi:hypothetical protein